LTIKGIFPEQMILAWDLKPIVNKSYLELYALRGYDLAPHKSFLDGNSIASAKSEYSELTAKDIVDIQFDERGTAEWKQLTRRNKGRSLAFCIDKKVYSAPNVISEIEGGHASVAGDYTKIETEFIANILESHQLAAQIHILKVEKVGWFKYIFG